MSLFSKLKFILIVSVPLTIDGGIKGQYCENLFITFSKIDKIK
jgi:hypothetical protein